MTVCVYRINVRLHGGSHEVIAAVLPVCVPVLHQQQLAWSREHKCVVFCHVCLFCESLQLEYCMGNISVGSVIKKLTNVRGDWNVRGAEIID